MSGRRRRMTAFLTAGVLLTLLSGAARAQIVATGGNVTNDIGGYRIHMFTNTGTTAFSVQTGGYVDVLVVAGGGGGGTCVGGGGGAGGLIYTNTFNVVAGSNYTVTVGAGGAPQANGSNSVFGPLVAFGGGRGGSWEGSGANIGQDGGSGGGRAPKWEQTTATSGVEGQGHGGGKTWEAGANLNGGAGGGGAGSPGTNGTSAAGGRGGMGRQIGISGSSAWYAGGGGGGERSGSGRVGTEGGLGGGGAGVATGIGSNGVANTGGGGGGGSYDGAYRAGGSGGSGIVIVRYFYFLASDPLSVHALPATDIGPTNAVLNGVVGGFGDAEAPKVYLCWGTVDGMDSNTGAWQRVVFLGDAWSPSQPIQHAVYDFNIGETNTYRIYTTNSAGGAWSDAVTFTTIGFPAIGIGEATGVDYRAATLHGYLTDSGDVHALVGFDWWPLGGSTNSLVIGEMVSGAFSTNLTGLPPGTDYEYVAWASNSALKAWSATNTWQTWALRLPEVAEQGAPFVARYEATLDGDLTDAGDYEALVGFAWWEPGNTITNTVALAIQPAGTFRAVITHLTADTSYEFAAWASNEFGKAWSATNTFTTDDLTPRTYNWSGPANGDWFTSANWDPFGIPGDGVDTARMTGNSMLLTAPAIPAVFEMTGGTLTFSNWNTRIEATTILISNAVVTLPPAFSEAQMSNRVHFVATDFTLAEGAQINADGRGFLGVNGKGGGGDSGSGGGGGGHGGYGGHGSGVYRTTGSGGAPYGDIAAPAGPGSGGGWGYSASYPGSAGGGAVRIEAGGGVTIDGTISANGAAFIGNYSGGGSGGAIHIVCDTYGGGAAGILRADGGSGARNSLPGSGGGGGSGGRIAIHFNNLNGQPQTTVSVKPGLTFYTEDINVPGLRAAAQPGTLYFSNPALMDAMLAAKGGNADGINGYIHFANTNRWTPGIQSMIASDIGIPEGHTWSFPGALTMNGSRLWVDPMAKLVCENNLTLTNASALKVYGGATNGLEQSYATLVQVAGTLRLATNAWVYPFAHSSDGGAPLFRVGSLAVAGGGGVNADGRGYTRGTGHGAGTGTGGGGGGGGYGCKGGRGQAADAAGGMPYGNQNAPIDPGSGGGHGYGSAYPGGHGGGVIRIETTGEMTIDGLLTANGTGVPNQWPGGGSGGGIYLVCGTFSGGASGMLRANGADVFSASPLGGGGSGGRIAVWDGVSDSARELYLVGTTNAVVRDSTNKFYTGSMTVTNGLGWKNPPDADGANPGSAWFFTPKRQAGSMLMFR